MHVVTFVDQHVDSVGGAQVSVRLQQRYLERAGHAMTVVGPKQWTTRGRALRADAENRGIIDLPSLAVPTDVEYSVMWPGAAADAAVDRELSRRVARGLPMPDLVHVQADFWGAFLGYRFAERLSLPVVHTMHNRVDVGIRATSPAPKLTLRILNAWRRFALGQRDNGRDGRAYLSGLAVGASAVTAPSSHFARRLEVEGVFAGVDVVWNGIDDDVRARVLERASRRDSLRRPRFIWVGRMSPEKRLLPLLEAFASLDVDAELEVVGGGFEQGKAERFVRTRGLARRVRLLGRLPYEQTLERIAGADALVQTSLGFETQGMTPFEAATLGTPSVISDPDVAGEFNGGIWQVRVAVGEEARTAALAEVLAAAVADIQGGRAPVPSERVAREFLQSSRTAAMVDVYRRVLRE